MGNYKYFCHIDLINLNAKSYCLKSGQLLQLDPCCSIYIELGGLQNKHPSHSQLSFHIACTVPHFAFVEWGSMGRPRQSDIP